MMLVFYCMIIYDDFNIAKYLIFKYLQKRVGTFAVLARRPIDQ